MRATIVIDDELSANAQESAGTTDASAVVSAALKALLEREAARRLARMGGTRLDATAATAPLNVVFI
jgi:Arc/MetJ family transcription regulator